jgi:hypothetical protein
MTQIWNETLEKADISINTSGDNVIIAAPGNGKYLAIDHINLVPAAVVIVQLKDGSTNYGGAYPLTTSQGFVLENAIQNDHGVITCSNNSGFTINLSGAVQVSGFIRYRIVNK